MRRRPPEGSSRRGGRVVGGLVPALLVAGSLPAVAALLAGCSLPRGTALLERSGEARAAAQLSDPSEPGAPGARGPGPPVAALARAGEGPLAVKARIYAARIERIHRSPEGILIYRCDPARRREHPERYGDLADAAVWTGALLAAESFRYAATRDDAALAAVRRSVAGLRALQEVTGVPGLLARSIDRDPRAADRGGPWRRGAGAWKDVFWRGDVSKDQLIGVMFGYGIALAHVDDPAVRGALGRDVAAIAGRILDDGLEITGADGRRTTYGDLEAEFWGLVPIGLNALIALTTFRVAYEATGDARFERAYRGLIDEGYAEIAYWAKFEVLGKTNHSNDSMAFMAYAVLLSLEDDPRIRWMVERSLERTWTYVQPEGNAFFDIVYAGLHRPSRPAIDDARATLRAFPPRKVLTPVDLTNRPGIERGFWRNRRGEPKGVTAVPIEERAASSFQWKSCPYALRGGRITKRTHEFAGTDYLLAYWMGRAFGFIGPGD